VQNVYADFEHRRIRARVDELMHVCASWVSIPVPSSPDTGVIERTGQSLRRVASGIVAMRSSEPLSLRLEKVYASLIDVMDAHHPDEFSIETAFYGKNVQSDLEARSGRGVAILAAVHRSSASRSIPRARSSDPSPARAAAKQQVEFMVKRLLNMRAEFRSSDEADAWRAICHSFRMSAPASFRVVGAVRRQPP